MPRVSRMIVQNQTAVYHVMSRTALDGFQLEAFEKRFFVEFDQADAQFVLYRGFLFLPYEKLFSSLGKNDSGKKRKRTGTALS